MMPFCVNCGASISTTQRYCGQCGTALHTLQPSESMQPDSVLFGRQHPMTAEPSAGLPSVNLRLLIVVGTLAVLLSGLAGYWWLRPPAVAPGSPVETTEQVVASEEEQAPNSETRGTANAPGAPARGASAQGEQPSWTVVAEFTQDAKSAFNALGGPDEKVAAIMPGGTLALAYLAGEHFYNGPGADLRVVGPEAERTPYTVFVRESQDQKWVHVDINRSGFPQGRAIHDFGHHGIQRAAQVMIRNDGTVNLYIDAVSVLHTQPEPHEEESHEHPRG